MHQQRWNLFVIWLLFSLNLEFRLNGFLLLYEDPLEEEGFVIWGLLTQGLMCVRTFERRTLKFTWLEQYFNYYTHFPWAHYFSFPFHITSSPLEIPFWIQKMYQENVPSLFFEVPKISHPSKKNRVNSTFIWLWFSIFQNLSRILEDIFKPSF